MFLKTANSMFSNCNAVYLRPMKCGSGYPVPYLLVHFKIKRNITVFFILLYYVPESVSATYDANVV